MKKSTAIILATVVLALLINGCGQSASEVKSSSANNTSTHIESTQKSVAKLKNGTYEGRYDDGSEGYYCKAKITIENNKITKVDWNIYDSSNVLFDEKYEDHFTEEEYKQQCRDNLKGSKNFTTALIEKQDTQEVDAISGASWSYTFFKGAVNKALENAR